MKCLEMSKVTNEKIIELRKEYSRLTNKSKQQAKKSENIWCGQKITQFCDSH